MSRTARSRLLDIVAACEAIADHLRHIETDEGLVFDAIRIRLIEIGEAAKDLPAELTRAEKQVPWTSMSRMRDHLAHRYFDSTHSIVFDTARNDVPLLAAAARRLLEHADR